MVFSRSIVAELANAAGAVFTVLFSIIFSVALISGVTFPFTRSLRIRSFCASSSAQCVSLPMSMR